MTPIAERRIFGVDFLLSEDVTNMSCREFE